MARAIARVTGIIRNILYYSVLIARTSRIQDSYQEIQETWIPGRKIKFNREVKGWVASGSSQIFRRYLSKILLEGLTEKPRKFAFIGTLDQFLMFSPHQHLVNYLHHNLHSNQLNQSD